MTGSVGNNVGVAPIRLRQIVIHRVEQESRDNSTGGNRTAWVSRERDVVVHHRAERPVKEIERVAIFDRRPIERLAVFPDMRPDINEHAAARSE